MIGWTVTQPKAVTFYKMRQYWTGTGFDNKELGGWFKISSGHDWTGTGLDRTGFDKKEWVGGIKIG